MRPRKSLLRRGLGLLPCAALLTACGIAPSGGIAPTGVIDAGPPATGAAPPVVLYFVRGSTVAPVPYRVPGAPGPEESLRMLLAGPQKLGLPGVRTALPASAGSPRVSGQGAELTVTLPGLRSPLSGLAALQVVCTIVSAVSHEGTPPAVTVTVVTGDGRRATHSGADCPPAERGPAE